MSKKNFSFLWVISGPGFLFAALLLLIYRAGPVLGRPVWLCGLCVLILIALFISYHAFKEIVSREHAHFKLEAEKELQNQNIRSVFDEAQALYRQKVENLEKVIQKVEQEYQQLQKGYEESHAESQKERAQASNFYTSLEDALDQLRALRFETYLRAQQQKSLPKDLPSQYKQLREQFEEKALVLDQTRRRLFVLEGQLLALKREQENEKIQKNEEYEILLTELKEVYTENQILVEIVENLEKLVATTKSTKSKPKEKVEKLLEFQFFS